MLHFHLDGEPRLRRYWWIVVQPGDEDAVDVCRTDPGHPVTLTVTATGGHTAAGGRIVTRR